MQTKQASAAADIHEARVRGLEALVNAQPALLPSLARNIALPSSNARQFVIDFLLRYIENLPEFIDTMSAITKAAGIFDFTKTFIAIAEEFHHQHGKATLDHAANVQALVAEAYLAHRLFEEMNDYITTNTGTNLLPIDLTPANIIAHEILGEDFANKLDLAVHYCIETLFDAEQIADCKVLQQFILHGKENSWNFAADNWPSLAGDKAIILATHHAYKYGRREDDHLFDTKLILH